MPQNEKEMFENIYNYLDKIIGIVQPRKLIYLAIDGVAPRAKMNQQRGRRFKSGLENVKSSQQKVGLLQSLSKDNGNYEESLGHLLESKFDHNVITPGTQFMVELSEAVHMYLKQKLSLHPHWSNCKVVFSDWSVPGEGEHKILEFIRLQRVQSQYDPNTTHCIYGADADLIMLGLSTHEPWFYILRETIMQPNDKQCSACGSNGHFYTDCTKLKKFQEYKANLQNREIRVNF